MWGVHFEAVANKTDLSVSFIGIKFSIIFIFEQVIFFKRSYLCHLNRQAN